MNLFHRNDDQAPASNSGGLQHIPYIVEGERHFVILPSKADATLFAKR